MRRVEVCRWDGWETRGERGGGIAWAGQCVNLLLGTSRDPETHGSIRVSKIATFSLEIYETMCLLG